MAGRRDHRIPLIFTVTVLVAIESTVYAQQQEVPYDTRSTAVVYTTSDSTVVEAERTTKKGASAGEEGSSKEETASRSRKKPSRSKNSGSAKPKCRTTPSTVGSTGDGAPGVKQPYDIYCSGEYTGTAWVLDDGNPSPRTRTQASPVPPLDISERIREEFPLPTGTIRINPGRGLVGTESWFWLEGVRSEPSTQTTDAFGTPLQVESRVTRYEWSFGDGKTMQTVSPGRPYPERSDIQHIFQRAPGAPKQYSVEVRFRYAVRYSTDGINWTELPDVSRTATASYQVRESQAVISR